MPGLLIHSLYHFIKVSLAPQLVTHYYLVLISLFLTLKKRLSVRHSRCKT
jgi:hypothetical protein